MEKWLGLTLKQKPTTVTPGKIRDRPEKELEHKRKSDQTYDATKRIHCYLPAWQVGRPWLSHDASADKMKCTFCTENIHHHAEVGSFTLGTTSIQLTSVELTN